MYIFCTDCNQTKLYTHKAMIQTISRMQAAALITLKEQKSITVLYQNITFEAKMHCT